MQRPTNPRQERAELRRLARNLRKQDPELAHLLSGERPYLLPPLRLTSLPTFAYAAVGAVLLVTGFVLGVGSAVFWGLVTLMMAVARNTVGPPDAGPTESGRLDGRTRRTDPTRTTRPERPDLSDPT